MSRPPNGNLSQGMNPPGENGHIAGDKSDRTCTPSSSSSTAGLIGDHGKKLSRARGSTSVPATRAQRVAALTGALEAAQRLHTTLKSIPFASAARLEDRLAMLLTDARRFILPGSHRGETVSGLSQLCNALDGAIPQAMSASGALERSYMQAARSSNGSDGVPSGTSTMAPSAISLRMDEQSPAWGGAGGSDFDTLSSRQWQLVHSVNRHTEGLERGRRMRGDVTDLSRWLAEGAKETGGGEVALSSLEAQLLDDLRALQLPPRLLQQLEPVDISLTKEEEEEEEREAAAEKAHADILAVYGNGVDASRRVDVHALGEQAAKECQAMHKWRLQVLGNVVTAAVAGTKALHLVPDYVAAAVDLMDGLHRVHDLCQRIADLCALLLERLRSLANAGEAEPLCAELVNELRYDVAQVNTGAGVKGAAVLREQLKENGLAGVSGDVIKLAFGVAIGLVVVGVGLLVAAVLSGRGINANGLSLAGLIALGLGTLLGAVFLVLLLVERLLRRSRVSPEALPTTSRRTSDLDEDTRPNADTLAAMAGAQAMGRVKSEHWDDGGGNPLARLHWANGADHTRQGDADGALHGRPASSRGGSEATDASSYRDMVVEVPMEVSHEWKSAGADDSGRRMMAMQRADGQRTPSSRGGKKQAGAGWGDVSMQDVLEYAATLGIDPVEDAELLWIAEQGLKAPLPESWNEYVAPNGNPYYHNRTTGVTTWDHPLDNQFQALYLRMKAEKEALRRRAQVSPTVGASQQVLGVLSNGLAAPLISAAATPPLNRKTSLSQPSGAVLSAYSGLKQEPFAHDNRAGVGRAEVARQPSMRTAAEPLPVAATAAALLSVGAGPGAEERAKSDGRASREGRRPVRGLGARQRDGGAAVARAAAELRNASHARKQLATLGAHGTEASDASSPAPSDAEPSQVPKPLPAKPGSGELPAPAPAGRYRALFRVTPAGGSAGRALPSPAVATPASTPPASGGSDARPSEGARAAAGSRQDVSKALQRLMDALPPLP